MADPPTVSSWKKRHDSKLASVHKELAKRQVEYDLLKEENTTLKAENDTLKAENDTLKAENATLKADLAKALAEEEKEKTILSEISTVLLEKAVFKGDEQDPDFTALLEGLQSREFWDVVN